MTRTPRSGRSARRDAAGADARARNHLPRARRPDPLLDPRGNGLSYSHIANLAAGRELPSRRALELLARAFELPASYFAEYRLAELRRQLDEREVGFATAYRTYQTISRRRPIQQR